MHRFLLATLLLPVFTPVAVRAQDDDRVWAFRSVERPAIPQPRDVVRMANPVDAFILKSLEKVDLTLSPPASRRTREQIR